MPTGLLTRSQYTTNPPSQLSADDTLEVRGFYTRSFIAGDGVTPVSGNFSNGAQGPYYSIGATLNGDGDLVVAAQEIQATTLSNPTANYIEQLWVNGAFVATLLPNTAGISGWQIPTVYGDPIAYDEIATYNRAKTLVPPPGWFDIMIQEIDRRAGNFDYMAVGVNGIGRASFPPVVASEPVVLMENDPRVGDWFNIEAYSAATTNTAAQNAVFIAAANAAALAAGGGIYIPVGTFVTNSVSITVPRLYAPGGILSAPSGQTITYTKSQELDISQHFAGLGSHVFSTKNLTILCPQYWGIANDGTTNDTVPFTAFVNAVNSSHAVGYLTPFSKILIGTTISPALARGFTLRCDIDARNFNPNAPQLIWNGAGGTMFDFEIGQQVLIEGIYFNLASTKSVDSFVKFDGDPASQIGTQGTIRYCSFDAIGQSNASAKLISISPTALQNHENYYIGYSDFYVSSGSRATAAGTAIYNGGNNGQAKHNVIEHVGINFGAVGIDVVNGSVDISHVGGGSNAIGVRIQSNTEPITIDHYEAEGDLQAVSIAASNGGTALANCRWSNFNQTNAGGFVKIDGKVLMTNCTWEYDPPVGGTLIEDVGTGNLGLIAFGNNFSNSGVTLAQAGITGFAASSTYLITPARGGGLSNAAAQTITNKTQAFINNGSLSAEAFQVTQTWNNGASTFTGIKENITDSVSDAASLLLDLQVASASKFKISKSGLVTEVEGGALTVSGNAIAPTSPIHQVGAGLIKNITLPSGFVSGTIALIPTAAFTYDATGNVLGTGTAVVGRTMLATYSSSTSKWSMSY